METPVLNIETLSVFTLTPDEQKTLHPVSGPVLDLVRGHLAFLSDRQKQAKIDGAWLVLANKHGFDPVSVVQTDDLPSGSFYARRIVKGMAINPMHLTLDQAMHRTRIIR